ncbi:phosphate-starvation-inducible PsiE family protein [Halochromatium roseum]|uniref:phosphate-starvation-inducible PsiE family protein n=1 Tax=Halochromatium roseum TaxID=391920 RepID=UPI001F5E057F|nr:phosphate-starvation-inducible PsiE family protein [Halochromatium roseum]
MIDNANQTSDQNSTGHDELPTNERDPILRWLHRIMRVAAYVLAIAMVFVILVGVISVLHTIYLNLIQPPYFLIPDIIKTFGAFLAVLIAYEIFSNIRLYIRSDVFPMKLVVATAIMAIARKIIILDMAEYSALDLIGMGVIVVGLGITYWLISLADRAAEAKDQPPVAASSLLPGSKTKANTN